MTPLLRAAPSAAAVPGLSRAARAFRLAHAAIAGWFLWAIAYTWWCAVTGRRDPRLRWAIGSLIAEGVAVTINHGDCPLGGWQEHVGDPVPLFELVLSPPAAKRAVPALGMIASAAIGLVAWQDRSRAGHADDRATP